jgi:hypothetical protein
VLVHHRHAHRHGNGPAHVHLHDHDTAIAHDIAPWADAEALLHAHRHETSARTALLIILGLPTPSRKDWIRDRGV